MRIFYFSTGLQINFLCHIGDMIPVQVQELHCMLKQGALPAAVGSGKVDTILGFHG
jgi:hypothetical protein